MRKFWNNASGSFRFDSEALHAFLMENGFGKLSTGNLDDAILIRIEGRIVKTVTNKDIRGFCWKYIDETYVFPDPAEKTQVKNGFYNERMLFSNDNLLLLPDIQINEVLDTADTSYMFFKNCILKITADGVQKMQYDEIQGHVFREEIIDYELKTKDVEDCKGEFYMFIQDLCLHENKQIESNNLESLMSIIGYVLHRYKNPGKGRAIVLMDPYRGDGANGGTGKSLLTKAFEKIRPSVYEDGKFFHTRDRFALSQVNYNTRVLVIDDIPKNFEFSKLFPLITEKAVVERKYQNKYTILYERSPKIVITTNYTLEGNDISSNRRKIEFILSDFYNSDNTPESKFGNLLFVDWNDAQWENFYVLMAYCLWNHLLYGIIKPKFNLADRALKMEAHPRFIDYMGYQSTTGVKYNKKETYDIFYAQYPGVAKVELTTFRRWLKLYADAKGFKMNESHSGNENFFEYSVE